MKLKKVLLIDDDETVNFINRKLIEKSAIAEEIISKNNALKALEDLKKEMVLGNLPDLIFVDIRMPIMDGWEFIEKFSDLGPETATTKIILLTSLINPSDVERAENIPAISAFREKPVTIEMLDDIEQNVL